MRLMRAETAFRAMKSPPAERPIFHHLEHRVEAHIFLCVLAYHLLVAIETTLLERGCHSWWGTAGETLAGHQVATIVSPADNGAILKIRKGTAREPQHIELYRLPEVPAEIIPPQKNWILPQGLHMVTEKPARRRKTRSTFERSAEVGLVPEHLKA